MRPRARGTLRVGVVVLLTGGLLVGGGVSAVAGAAPAFAETGAPQTCQDSKNKSTKPRAYFTMPALAGVHIVIGGASHRTSSTGWVVLPPAKHVCGDEGRPTVPGAVPMQNGLIARFQRLYGNRILAFGTSRKVQFTFRTQSGAVLDRSALDDVRVKSSTGVQYDVPPSGLLELPAQRVIPLAGSLQVKDIYYTVEKVVVRGNNVVNRSQVRFYPAKESAVTVPMLYFDAEVRISDRIFGVPFGRAVLVRSPDGTTTRHPLRGGAVQLPLLPRGQYEMQAEAAGLKVWRPVAMSRDQVIDLDVMSWFDVIVLMGLGVSLAGGALVVGRRRRAALHRPRAPVRYVEVPGDEDVADGGPARPGDERLRPLIVLCPVQGRVAGVSDLTLPRRRIIDLRDEMQPAGPARALVGALSGGARQP